MARSLLFATAALADAAQGASEAVAPGPRAEAPTAEGVVAAPAAPQHVAQAGGLLRLGGLWQHIGGGRGRAGLQRQVVPLRVSQHVADPRVQHVHLLQQSQGGELNVGWNYRVIFRSWENFC